MKHVGLEVAPADVEVEHHDELDVVLEVRRVNDPRRLRRLVRLLADLALAEPLDKPEESGGG